MKKVILVVSALFIGSALADSAPTSVGYVDSQISTLQNKIGAVDNNTVLTHTTTAGEIGQKSIYDATGNYAEQQNALVPAEVANAAVQNAIDSEFVCTEWLDGAQHTNENCLIYTVHNPAPNRILPTGYTPLEYIESTSDASKILTNITWESVYRFGGIAQQTIYNQKNQAVLGSSYQQTSSLTSFWGTVSIGENLNEWHWSTGIPITTMVEFNIWRYDSAKWHGLVNGVSVSSTPTFRDNVVIMNDNQTSIKRGFIGKVWNIQLFDNNDGAIFNGVPARRDSDGEIGMYDIVSNTFFTNSGTGEFIAGPELNVWLPNGN